MATAIKQTGFDYDGLPQAFVKASRGRAKKIKDMDAQTGRNLVEMGQLLKEQRDSFGSLGELMHRRGGDTWTAWLLSELGCKRDYATRLIQIFERFGAADPGSTANLSYHQMQALSTRSAAPIFDEAMERIASGENLSANEINAMKKSLTDDIRPPPSDAKAKAQETGEVIIGSDNRIYTPISDEDHQNYQERRALTYAVLDAIRTFPVDIYAKDWLADAEERWLADFSLADLDAAIEWLTELRHAYKVERKII